MSILQIFHIDAFRWKCIEVQKKRYKPCSTFSYVMFHRKKVLDLPTNNYCVQSIRCDQIISEFILRISRHSYHTLIGFTVEFDCFKFEDCILLVEAKNCKCKVKVLMIVNNDKWNYRKKVKMDFLKGKPHKMHRLLSLR